MTRPTLGVEEEFLLLDPRTGENLSAVEKVVAALPEQSRDAQRWEFRRCMLEMVTPVCADLAELRAHLTAQRQAAGEAAAGAGARLVAMGATPVADTDREPVDDPRFRAIADFYGPVAHDPAVCGCHVHVGVPSREQAILVCNHLRRWLPVVQALAVNSPLHNGRDTGSASWRATQLDRWPALGPTPAFSSAVAYDDAIDALVREGVMLDSTMVLWYARPSRNYPTVEVRVADVCLTADDAVLVAGLVRGLVATALDLVSAGIDPPEVPDHLIAAAHHFAARDGLDAALLDPSSGTEKPAWEVVESLVDLVSPALTRHGDIALIQHGLDRLRRDGTGAARQRAFLGPGGDFAALLDFVATRTTRP